MSTLQQQTSSSIDIYLSYIFVGPFLICWLRPFSTRHWKWMNVIDFSSNAVQFNFFLFLFVLSFSKAFRMYSDSVPLRLSMNWELIVLPRFLTNYIYVYEYGHLFLCYSFFSPSILLYFIILCPWSISLCGYNVSIIQIQQSTERWREPKRKSYKQTNKTKTEIIFSIFEI